MATTENIRTESITVGQPLAGTYRTGAGTTLDFSGRITEVHKVDRSVLRLTVRFNSGRTEVYRTNLDGNSDNTMHVRTCPTCHELCSPFGLAVLHKR